MENLSPVDARVIRALVGTSAAQPRPLADTGAPPEAARVLDRGPGSTWTPAAVLVAIMRRPEGSRVLLTERTQHLRNHAGQISFPGGRREGGDVDPAATALREAQEEVALDPSRARILGYLDDYPVITGFRVTPVVASVDQAAPLVADGVEVADCFEVPLSFLLDTTNYEQCWLRREEFDLPYYSVAYGDRVIWGATAGMLHELARRAGAAG